MTDQFDPFSDQNDARSKRPADGNEWPDSPGQDDGRPLTDEPAAAMRLRAEPPRVTRLSRKVLAGLGLGASLAVGGALIYALQNRQQSAGQELYSTDNRQTPDGLATLPKDYAGVPKLGPPLPGDLGRPILNAQNVGPGPSPQAVGPDPEEQRRQQELRQPGPRGFLHPPKPGLPAALLPLKTVRTQRLSPISPALASRRSPRRHWRRIGSAPSSISRPTGAPSRPIAWNCRRRKTSFRPVP